jgi:hypothetical protein
LNYTGGLGTKKDETQDLLGKIGTLDVQDCQDIVNQALKTIPSLNPAKTFVCGGSHGGFLACHLTSSFPVCIILLVLFGYSIILSIGSTLIYTTLFRMHTKLPLPEILCVTLT